MFGIQFKSGSYDYSFKVQKTPKENVSNYTKSNLPIHLLKKRFQLILPVANHNVKKNLTGHRMHVEGPQIYQMNRHMDSYQNM